MNQHQRSNPKDPEATKEALRKAGTQLFAEVGFDGARVDAIAERAGVNKAMINYHFQGKLGLYRDILKSTFDALDARFELIRTSDAPADEKMGMFIDLFAEMVENRPAFPAMVLREGISRGRLLGEELAPRLLNVFALLRQIIEQGVNDGDFRRVHPLMTHLSLIGSLSFFFATQPMRERLFEMIAPPFMPPTGKEFIQHTKELFSRGLSPAETDDAHSEGDVR